jgi:spermidine synthase
MNTIVPQRPDPDPSRRSLQLWRPEAEFEADWFVVELRWEDDEFLPSEAEIRRDLLTSALPLLRSPRVVFRQLPRHRMLVSIDSPDAQINVRVGKQDIAIAVQVVEDAEAAVRFCENADGTCGGGVNRVRTMPDGRAGPFLPLDSGYIFGRVIERRNSLYQTITLSEHPIYGRALLLNREIQIGERDEEVFSGTLVSHALSGDAKRVLILGGGDCGVLREVLTRPVERVVMVELDREVLRFCEEHLPAVVGGAPDDPRAELRFEDAFEYLAKCDERFDVVLSDLPDTPIADHTLDDQIGLMSRVLTETGALGTHAQLTKFEGPYEAEPIIAAISRRFENVEVTRQVIPSYQDQIWLFVRANGRRSEEGLA